MSEILTPVQQAVQQFRPAPPPSGFQVRRNGGAPVSEESVLQVWKERRNSAKRDRRRFETDWSLALHFLAGKQWVGVSRRDRRILDIRTDPRERNRIHVTENILTGFYETACGQILDDDLMPTLLSRKDDDWQGQKVTQELNLAYRYAYDEEWDGDEVLAEAIGAAVALGTGGVQVRLCRGKGESYGQFPVGPDGRLITDPAQAHEYVSQRVQNGQPAARMDELRGQIEWCPLLPHNILVPPGVTRWKDMPYVIVERAVPVDDLRAQFPDRAKDIVAQSLEVVDLVGMRDLPTQDATGGGVGKLEGHCLYSCGYEPPSKLFPQGRVVSWNGDVLLEEVPQLPFNVNGTPHNGVVPIRFRTIPGRWWGRGLPDDMIGVQTQRNRARSQHREWVDRNMGRVYATKGAITEVNEPTGRIRELIEIPPGFQPPQETFPGQHPPLLDEINMLNDAAHRVSGISEVSALSNAPAGVAAYAAFSFLKQQDDQRAKPVRIGIYRSIRELTRVSLEAIRLYWPPRKLVTINNDEAAGDLATFTYEKATMPSAIYVQIAKGSGHPTDPAAQTQLIFDVFDRGVSSGQPQPLTWLLDSVHAGKPLPLSDDLKTVQRDKAEMENVLMAQMGVVPPVAPYDDDQTHIQIHRGEEATHSLDQSPEAQMIVQRIEQHLQLHEQNMQQKAAQQIAAQTPTAQGPAGALGGAPEQGPPPGVPPAAQAVLSRLQGQ